MRIGQNPAKSANEVALPERITVAVLNYIPHLSGFYAEGLDVLKACMKSARTEAGLPFDLLVFDNGSCAEVQNELVQLHQAGEIQLLLLSEKNLGKGGAWNIIFTGAPGELIAYADSDVLFSPGWLAKSVEILETSPNVGMVTARPFRTPEKYSSATIEWAQATPEANYQVGQFLTWEEFSSFVLSLGTSLEITQGYYRDDHDLRVRYHDVPAQIGASHWQFLTRKATLQQYLPFSMDRPMGQVRQLDQRMNETGLLRLMTADCLAQNMSNTLPEELRGKRQAPQSARPVGWKRKLANLPFVKASLLVLYDRIFRLYN
jgi:hypothetical protein